MGYGPLPDWLRKKCCIHVLDMSGDDLCVCGVEQQFACEGI